LGSDWPEGAGGGRGRGPQASLTWLVQTYPRAYLTRSDVFEAFIPGQKRRIRTILINHSTQNKDRIKFTKRTHWVLPLLRTASDNYTSDNYTLLPVRRGSNLTYHSQSWTGLNTRSFDSAKPRPAANCRSPPCRSSSVVASGRSVGACRWRESILALVRIALRVCVGVVSRWKEWPIDTRTSSLGVLVRP